MCRGVLRRRYRVASSFQYRDTQTNDAPEDIERRTSRDIPGFAAHFRPRWLYLLVSGESEFAPYARHVRTKMEAEIAARIACERPITRGPNKGELATGTVAGYQRHRDAVETLCEPCAEAKRKFAAKWGRANPNYVRPVGYVRPVPTRETVERTMAKFTRSPDENGCTEWAGYRNRKGYGIASTGQRWPLAKSGRAHRIAWVLARGPIPEGLELDHVCENTSCVNVDHLQILTKSEHKRITDGRARERERSEVATG